MKPKRIKKHHYLLEEIAAILHVHKDKEEIFKEKKSSEFSKVEIKVKNL